MYAEQVVISRQEAWSVIMQDLVIESTKDNDADLPIRNKLGIQVLSGLH